MNLRKSIFYFFLASLVFFSCKKDLNDIKTLKENGVDVEDWNPTWAVPLVNSRTTLGDIYKHYEKELSDIGKTGLNIKLRPDGVFALNYPFEMESKAMNEYYQIPRHSENISLVVPEATLNTIRNMPQGASLDGVWDTTFAFDISPPYGALLERLETSSGIIDLNYSNNFNIDAGLEVTFRSIKNKATDQVEKSTLSSSNNTDQIQLDNHAFDLKYQNPLNNLTEYNRFEVYVKTVGTIDQSSLSGDRFELDMSVGDYYLTYVQGYLGIFDTELKVGIDTFDFFEKTDLEGLYLKEPKLTIDIESSLGMPMILRMDTFDFGYPDGTTKELGVNGRKTKIAGVSSKSQIPNQPRVTKDSIDYTNSNLSDVITSEPNKIMYGFNFTSTAENASDLTKFFLTDESKIKIKANAELPLIFSVYDYEYTDTTDLDSVLGDFNRDSVKFVVERAELKIIFETQLPFDVLVQGYFLDSTDNVIDILFPGQGHIVAANKDIDSDGGVKGVKQVQTIVDVDQKKFENIKGSTKLVYKVVGNTSNAQKDKGVYVKLKSDYVFGVKMGLRAKVKYDVPLITFD